MTVTQIIRWGAALAGALLTAAGAALPLAGRPAPTESFKQINLVADVAGVAAHTDQKLLNPWGMAFDPVHKSPFWVANNHSGTSTLYNGSGESQPLVVSIPAPGGEGAGAPTGQVFNSTKDFNGDLFIFATADGTIAGWKPASGTTAPLEVDNSADGAIYKGLAMMHNSRGNFLLAADFHSGKIDVFDKDFQPAAAAGTFTDPNTPAGFAPFSIHVVSNKVFVAYARQGAEARYDVKGPGQGFIDVFDTSGRLVKRFASGTAAGGSLSVLNSPWGVTVAPAGFGKFSKKLLVGNFGSGQIAAFHPKTGAFLGTLNDASRKPIAIDGLWEILPGGGGAAGDPKKLYFTAGPDEETHGLFGSLELSRGKG